MIFLFDELKAAVDINRSSPTIDIVTTRTVNNTIVKNILIMVPDNFLDLVGIVMFFLGYRYHYYSILYFC